MKALLGIVGGFVLTLAVFGSGLAFAAWILTAKPVRQATPTIGVSELWTKDAQPVDPAKQQLERIPAEQAAATPAKSPNPDSGDAARPDGQTRTAALATPAQSAAPRPLQPLPGFDKTDQPAAAANPAGLQQAPAQQQAQLPAAHVEWCANRYRSYRPEENSYRSYDGELRPCVSPYFDPDGATTTDIRQDDQGDQNDRGQMTDDQTGMDGYATSPDGYADAYGGPPEEIAPDQQGAQSAGEGRQVSADHIDNCFSRYRSYNPRDNTYQPFDGGPRRQCE